MRTFKLENNDLSIDKYHNIVLVQGDKEIAQSLERIFTTNTGEWFLNIYHGLEYASIQGKGVTDEQIQRAIITAALQDHRVREVIDIKISHNIPKRKIDIVFHCKVSTGETITVPFTIT